MNNRLITILSRAFLALSAAFVALVLLSWLLSAARPDLMVRSLLAPEGIRWFFRNLSHIIASPLLGWILLWSMAFGCISDSRLLCGVRNIRSLSSREQFALMMVVVELIVSVLRLFLLTLVPHAILLSSTGGLFPSPFTDSVIPLLAIIFIVMGITYGVFCQSLPSLGDVYKAMYSGVRLSLPLLPLYIIFVLFVNSLIYVFTL